MGKNLINLNNPTWSAHRKLLNPSFSHKVILSYLPIFNQEADSLISSIDELVGKEKLDLTNILQKCAAKTAIYTTLGVPLKRDNILQFYHTVSTTLTKIFYRPWLQIDWIFRFDSGYKQYKSDLQEVTASIYDAVLQNIAIPKSDKTLDENCIFFIDRARDWVKNGELTIKEVQEETLGAIMAAFETTENTAHSVLILLAMFPSYQEKVYDELKGIFPEEKKHFDISYEDIKNMVYLDMVVNETMRIMSPFPIISRTPSRDVQLSSGLMLPKGLTIVIDIFNMHRAEEYWGPQASTFDPDNFLPTKVAERHPYLFVPFSKGTRNCIGKRYGLLSVKIVLAKLLRSYRFSTKYKFDDLYYTAFMSIKLKTLPLLEIHARTEKLINDQTSI